MMKKKIKKLVLLLQSQVYWRQRRLPHQQIEFGLL